MTASIPLPPAARSVPTLALRRGASLGRFDLQRCGACGVFLYPVRDICSACLSQDLRFETAPIGGTLLSETTIRITGDPFFRSRPPVRQGLVRADCGVTMIAILHRDCPPEGRVRLSLKLDRGGQPVAYAYPDATEHPDLQDDPHLRDLTMSPKDRCVLITDAAHPSASALVAALRQAGAGEVLLGRGASSAYPGAEGVTPCDLDLLDDASVLAFVETYAARIDMVICTGPSFDKPVPASKASAWGTAAPEAGPLNLLQMARALMPGMASRGAIGWVVLHCPGGLTAQADEATLSFARSLRAEMTPMGLRVANVFVGGTDDHASPVVNWTSLAEAIVQGLVDGVEEIRVGPAAEASRRLTVEEPNAL